MLKLQEKSVYLAVMERAECKKVWEDFEYDFNDRTEVLNIGFSVEKADEWFDEIQKLQGDRNVRLGIFLNDATIIGDVALQDIDNKNRSCSVGVGIAKIENRCKSYAREAVSLMLEYGFDHMGMERITANTLEINIAAQKVLGSLKFTLEPKNRITYTQYKNAIVFI